MTTQTNASANNPRLSNLETLRIIAMSMILIHHFLVHSLSPENIPDNLYPLINAFVFSGPNIFFLISGHFGIKFSGRRLVRFILTIFFFGLVNLLLLQCVGEEVKLKHILNAILFPISGSPYWFIHAYFLLMLSAPLINAGLKTLPKEMLTKIILLFTAALIYMRGTYASYNYLNAAYMYCLGFYLREHDISALFAKWQLTGIFLISCLMAGVANAIALPRDIIEFMDYENIFIILSSVSLYLLFSKLSFSSRAINLIAASALGAYLLQDGEFGYKFLYDWQGAFLMSNGYGSALVTMFVICFMGFWLASYLLTAFMNLWINPVSEKLTIAIRNISGNITTRLIRR